MAAKGKQRASQLDLHIQDNDEDPLAFRRRMLHKLREGSISSHNVTAWCPCTGLIAYPTPASSSTSTDQPVASTSALPLPATVAPSIQLTLPPLPPPEDGEDSALSSFVLDLPEAPGFILRSTSGQEYISHLTFSPDGNYLAVLTSYKSDISPSSVLEDKSIRFILFARGDAINTWTCAFDWDAKRAKANMASPGTASLSGPSNVRLDAAGVLDVRWLQTASSKTGQAGTSEKKRGYDAMLDLSGSLSLAAVLQSNELLVIHLPYQAIQPQVYLLSLDDMSVTTQDISMFGTSFSAMPVPLPSANNPINDMLNGALDTLGMNLAGNAPMDPLQFQQSLANMPTSTSSQGLGKEIRLAAIGSCTTEQKIAIARDAPPALITEFLLAYQESYQPKIYRQKTELSESGTMLQTDSSGMLLDGLTVTADNNSSLNKTLEPSNSAMEGIQSLNDLNPSQTSQVTTQLQADQNLGLSDYNLYGQANGFGSGYGDINLSALDELFDNDFSSGGMNGNTGLANNDSTMGGLSSTLDSINQDFASSFPSATEPDGAPSPTKKESKDTPQAQPGAQNGSSSFEAGTHRSDSPSKSVIDGTYGSGSRGSSPRKGLGVNGGEDELPEIMDGALEGGRAEALSEIRLSQVKIEWTEYGVLSISINAVSTITSQTASLSETASAYLGVITHMQLVSGSRRTTSRLLALSSPLSEQDEVRQTSNVQAYDISQEPFMLCEAFMTLEGRKAHPDLALLESSMEWVVEPVPAEHLHWLQTGAVLDLRESRGGLVATILREDGRMELAVGGSKDVELSALLPSYYPMSLAVSPSGRMAVACALDDGRVPCHIGNPVIFKVGPNDNNMASHDSKAEIANDAQGSQEKSQRVLDALAASLVDNLIARRSVRDVLLSAARCDADSKTRLLRMSWNVASDMLQGGKVEQTRLIWPLLAIQRRLQIGLSSVILDDLLQLSACLRIMQDNKSTLRHASQQIGQQNQVNEVFDGDAVWPIIGHISWLFDLWDRIILQMTSDKLDKDWSSASFLIMHPLPRMLQQRLIRLIARFANYMMNLREGAVLVPTMTDTTKAVLDTELAKTVLGDIIVGHRQKTQEWNNMLQGLTNKLGTEWSDDITKGREALINLKLPPELERTAREMAFGMKQKLLPLLSKADKVGLSPPLDVVGSHPLKPGIGSYKTCTLCSGRTQLIMNTQENEWEYSKRRTCICGGQWVVA